MVILQSKTSTNMGLSCYQTNIKPLLKYGTTVWGGPPQYLEDKLENIQTRSLRILALIQIQVFCTKVILSVGILASSNCFQFLRVYVVFISRVSELGTFHFCIHHELFESPACVYWRIFFSLPSPWVPRNPRLLTFFHMQFLT